MDGPILADDEKIWVVGSGLPGGDSASGRLRGIAGGRGGKVNAIDLTGLRADNPMGAMAAFGSLRIAERSDLLRGSKLSWKRHAGSFHAVLSTSSPVLTSGKLVEILVEDLCATQSRSELCWSEQIKSATEEM